ncbi:MAG: hypothetical protein V7L21_18555 [Nostoc sp.]|uniref:hypothetical protein n=1 Tax=unclassified Nostoc TaxID=2593658 RepID=UPI0025E6CDF2|nr:hypothetical protein [Nostoc sp. NMS9]MBN3942436.1 hypothetical protein [Nostoc sp. NMS9]
MSSDQRLEQKRQGLQQQYDLVAEKLNRLRFDYAIVTDVLIRFEREKQIEQTEGELKELEQQLYYLEQSVSSERLYQALLKLGYRKQTREFRKFIEVHSTAAFLIHGSPDYGQRWLLNRLVVQHVPSIITGKIVRIDLSRISRRSDINALWRELGGRVDLDRQSTIPEIADRVYRLWQTQNVLLIFYDVNCLQEAFLNELIQNFWLPLATKAKEATLQTSQFKLLMFLVDYDGCSGSWNVPFAESQNSWKLTEITEFSEAELTEWLDYEEDALPTKLIDQIDKTIQIILKNSDNGIPELTFCEICRLSDCNWDEQEEKWLRL